MGKLVTTLAASLSIVTGVCATELAGTAWQLQSIQSMDDAQGTTSIPDPSRLTVAFGTDGRASFQLDCNRGMGDWKVESTHTDSGRLTFGSIAATRAMCAPPQMDVRVARDMVHVRSYQLKDGKLFMSLMADGGIYEWAPLKVAGAASNSEPTVKPVQFPKGRTSTVIRDRIVGSQTIDYQLQAEAGKLLKVNLKDSKRASYFNLLPPDSSDAAMFNGSLGDNRFTGLLPDDGIYTLRVYLMRAAARRNESSDFTLSVSVTGGSLKPLSTKRDALLPGTRFHASTPMVTCTPAYSNSRQCEAFVVRRGNDGTATVELRWDGEHKRRILFVKGEPKASDSSQRLSTTRDERGWKVRLGEDELFEIPEALVFGG